MRSSIKTGGYCFRTYRSCIIHCNAYEQMHGGHDRSLWRHASDLVHEFGLAERVTSPVIVNLPRALAKPVFR